MRRRQVLAAGTALLVPLLAGCAEPAGVLELTAVEDAEIARRASRRADDLPDEHRAAVRAAIEDGSGTTSDTHPPIEAGLPVAHEGRYYDLAWTVVSERSETIYDLEIDYDPADASGPAIAYDDLPEVDRTALADLLPPRDDRRVEGIDVGVGVTYSDAEAEASVLVPAQQYEVVVHDGTRYRVAADDGREITVKTYRYTASEAASSAEAYAVALRDRYLFTLSGLSDAEREVVESAIDGGYYAESDSDDAFRSVAVRLRSHDAIQSSEYDGAYLVRYDGTVYWTDLYLGRFVEE